MFRTDTLVPCYPTWHYCWYPFPDGQKPQIRITSPSDGQHFSSGSAIYLAVTISDDDGDFTAGSLELEDGDNNWSNNFHQSITGSSSVTRTLSDGVYTFYAHGSDAKNHFVTDSVVFAIGSAEITALKQIAADDSRSFSLDNYRFETHRFSVRYTIYYAVPVQISFYDLKGRMIGHYERNHGQAGKYTAEIPAGRLSNAGYIGRISSGSRHSKTFIAPVMR